MNVVKCDICKATSSREWHTCVVCGSDLCEECAVQCDKCRKFYCIGGECGDDYQDEAIDYNFCYKCK